jgi:hypothetical protein
MAPFYNLLNRIVKIKYLNTSIMKNFILSAAILTLAGITSVKANEIKIPVAVTVQQDSASKTPVKLEELPDAVKTTLKADAYKEWAPTDAFLITNADKSSYYQVDVKKGTEAAFIKIGKDGTVIQ